MFGVSPALLYSESVRRNRTAREGVAKIHFLDHRADGQDDSGRAAGEAGPRRPWSSPMDALTSQRRRWQKPGGDAKRVASGYKVLKEAMGRWTEMKRGGLP